MFDYGSCATPGRKIRSGGRGRGLARGQGRGPIGTPAGLETPGVFSGMSREELVFGRRGGPGILGLRGRGRGLGRGMGRGMGRGW